MKVALGVSFRVISPLNRALLYRELLHLEAMSTSLKFDRTSKVKVPTTFYTFGLRNSGSIGGTWFIKVDIILQPVL